MEITNDLGNIWKREDVILFIRGIQLYRLDFEKIQQNFLPNRSISNIGTFYDLHNDYLNLAEVNIDELCILTQEYYTSLHSNSKKSNLPLQTGGYIST